MPVPSEVANDIYDAIQRIVSGVTSPTSQIPGTGADPGTVFGAGGIPPIGGTGSPSGPFSQVVSPPDYGNNGIPPSSQTAPDGSMTFPWAGVQQNNPQYPYALWGGKDNFDAQKPPDWMVKMVDEALAMPVSDARTARIKHILENTNGMPDYLITYLKSRLS